jgi:hypothetical protein
MTLRTCDASPFQFWRLPGQSDKNMGKLLRSARLAQAGEQESGENACRYRGRADRWRTHLLVLPGAKAAGTYNDGASFRFGQGLLDGRLARIARNQVPFVQPRLDSFPRQSTSQVVNIRFICTAMRKKDVERHLGVALSENQSGRMLYSILYNWDCQSRFSRFFRVEPIG